MSRENVEVVRAAYAAFDGVFIRSDDAMLESDYGGIRAYAQSNLTQMSTKIAPKEIRDGLIAGVCGGADTSSGFRAWWVHPTPEHACA